MTGLAENSGLAKAKMVLNALHAEMAIQGFEEGHVHQENDVSGSLSPSKHEIPSEYLWVVYCDTPCTAHYTERIYTGGSYGVQQGVKRSRI